MINFRQPTRRDLLLIGRSASIGGIAGTAFWAVAYLSVLHAIFAGLLCVMMLVACSVLLVWSHRALKALKARQPDYALIASMEREVWGETFRHEGGRSVLVNEIPPGYAPSTGGSMGGPLYLPARNAQGGVVGCDHERLIELCSHAGRIGWLCGGCGTRLPADYREAAR